MPAERTGVVSDMTAAAVAVVGMGIRVPGAASPEEFWKLLMNGAEIFGDPPPERWRSADFTSADPESADKTYQASGGIIDDDPLDKDDYSQRWLRCCVDQAMAEVARPPRSRYSLCLGYTTDGSLHQEETLLVGGILADAADLEPDESAALSGALRQHYVRAGDPSRYLPHRIARDAIRRILPDDTRVHLVDTACSSSLYAIDLGVREILSDEVDVAVCGGAQALTPTMQVLFAQNGGLSRTGQVRSMDVAADGVLFSDGAAVVVLKRLDRALADGDTVYGVIAGTGLSADGKGTSIYKPSADGQKLAMARAQHDSGVSPADVGLIVAHATGTPAGDVTELTGLSESYLGERPIPVVSNKSLVGHTGWAAGAVSVIHLLLALRHEMIPAQHRFDATRADAPSTDGLTIPRTPVAWPEASRPRAGAVSGFGFGGTNAHLVITDYAPGDLTTSPHTRGDDDVVIVGWSSRLPDDSAAFGPTYPLPTREQLRLPPPTVRRTDRSQLMAVECVNRMHEDVRAALHRRRERSGAIVGHAGPTRNGLLYRARAHLDEAARAAAEHGAGPPAERHVAAFGERIKALVPAPTEDSYPGSMPNVIAGRVSNTFDLRGLNVTVDQGEASLLEAFDIAARYLRTGALEMTLVCGVNGNTLPEWRAASHAGEVEAQEGAYLFALTTREIAEDENLPILAVFDGVERCDSGPRGTAGGFGGAEGGRDIVAFLKDTSSTSTQICRSPAPGEPTYQMTILRESGAQGTAEQNQLDRHVIELAPHPLPRLERGRPVVPPGALVLTNNKAPLDAFVRGGVVIGVSEDTPATELEKVFDEAPDPTHVMVVCDLNGVSPTFDASREHRAVVRLHDAMFLAARACETRWPNSNSFEVIVLGGVNHDRVSHPLTGLFTGFVKSLAEEMRTRHVSAVVHDANDFAGAISDLEKVGSSNGAFPVTYIASNQLLAVRARRQPLAPQPPSLTQSSVVVAAGGARGIGAEVLRALARMAGPRIYILGTTRIDNVVGGDENRAAFIRARTRGPEGLTVAQANRLFDHAERVREIRRTIAELGAHCGEGRVTYITCDLRDPGAVQQTISDILERDEQVDLLLNVAGIIRTARIGGKSLEDFTEVRDLKLHTHANLTRAFARKPPRIWCNFGSVNGFLGQAGDTDYAAANDFLYTAAEYAHSEGSNQYTIGFGLWGEAGFAAVDPMWRSYLDATGEFTPMGTKEGVEHFLMELAAADRTASTVQLGSREHAALERRSPGYSQWCRQANGSDGTGHQAPARRVSTAVTMTRVFDLDRDGYLLDHLVRGYPTLPGSFYPELAAEAAQQLCPDRVAVAFENVELSGFLRVYRPDRPHTVRVTASLREHGKESSIVDVRITSDVVAPRGQVLVRDKLHGSLTVHLRDSVPAAPRWTFRPPNDGLPAVHPLYENLPEIELSGMFRAVTGPSLDADGHRRAKLSLHQGAISRWFPSARTPQLAIEAVAQLSVVHGPTEPLAVRVPRSIRLIELFTVPRDGSWLFSSDHPLSDLDDPEPKNQAVAVTEDGLVAVRVTGLAAVVLGGS